MTACYFVDQTLLDLYVFPGALVADKRQAHLMDIEALDALQVELRERGLRATGKPFALLHGEIKARLIGVRDPRDGWRRVAFCDGGHRSNALAPVWKDVPIDLPLLRNAVHVHGCFSDDAQAAFAAQ